MSIYTNKSGRQFIQFDFRGVTYKKHLPPTITRDEAKQIELRWRHDLYLEEQGILTPDANTLWEQFVDCVYLEHVESNQSKESLDKAITICKASMPFFKGM